MTKWRPTRLGDEIELAYGRSLPAYARKPGPFDVFGSNGVVGAHSNPLVEGPGIVIGRKGSVGEVVFSHEPFWPIDTTYFVVNKGGNDWRFLYHLLRNSGLTGLNSHSAVPGLNREDVYSIDASFPDLSEQKQIARVIDTIEKSIVLEDHALAEAATLKRGAMHELFTRGLRGEAQKETDIGLMPAHWMLTPVVKIGEVKGGKRMPKGISLTAENTGRPYIRVTDFDSHSVDASRLLFVPRGIETVIARYTISSNDVYISIAGTIGLVGQVPAELDGANLTENAAKIIISQREEVHARYLMRALASPACQMQIVQATAKNAQPKLALTRIEQILIPLPPTFDEQVGIIEILDAIDRKIDLHKRKRAILDELFKALLHKLMIGEVRVADLDFSALDGSAKEEVAA